MTDTSNVRIVVVTYNSESLIERCLQAVPGRGMHSGPAVVVVDNASSDETKAIVGRFPEVVLVPNDRNVGFARAANIGASVEGAAWDSLLLLNPDATLRPDTIDQLLMALDRDPGLGAVAPVMLLPSGEIGVSGGRWPRASAELAGCLGLDDLLPNAATTWLKRHLHVRVDRSTAGVTEASWISGFAMMIRRDAWRAAGGFDDRFFLYYEDVDLCRRMRQHGWRSGVSGSAICSHVESASMTPLSKARHRLDGLTVYGDKHFSVPVRNVVRLVSRWMS